MHIADRGITAEQEANGEAAAAESGGVADNDESPDGEQSAWKPKTRRRNRGRTKRQSPARPVIQPEFVIGWD